MKKIALVTGADGFIGSHLVENLIASNYKVIALVQYNSFSSIGWLKNLKNKNLKIIFGDIRDINTIRKILKFKPKEIFHLAALISVPYSFENPNSFVETNITGTLNLFNELRNQKEAKKIIIVSSSEVYGTAIKTPITENHPLQAQSQYSASKIGCEKIAESFLKTDNLPVVVVRPFNTYGPRQSGRAVIPTIINQLLYKKKLKIGSLDTIRDFVYVKDTVTALINISKSNKTVGKTVNIATQKGVYISDLIKLILKEIKIKDIKIEKDKKRIRPINAEVNKLIGSNKALYKLIAWKPRFSLAAGIKETVNWYKKNYNFFYENDKYKI